MPPVHRSARLVVCAPVPLFVSYSTELKFLVSSTKMYKVQIIYSTHHVLHFLYRGLVSHFLPLESITSTDLYKVQNSKFVKVFPKIRLTWTVNVVNAIVISINIL